MFILERLTGVGTYAWLLIITVILICHTNANLRLLLSGYIAALCILAYFYVPYKTADLYRIFDMMKMYSSLPFSTFWRIYGKTSSVALARVLYWGIGRTKIYGLLPATATLICYSCFFYILEKSARLMKASRRNIAVALFFFMSVGQFMSVISNIRTMLVIAVISYCMFRESVEKKFSVLHIILYISMVFIHNIAVLLIVFRLICLMLDRDMSLQKRIIFLLLSAGCVIAVYRITSGVIGRKIVEMVQYYLKGGYSYIWEYIIGTIVILAAFYIGIENHYINKVGICISGNGFGEFKLYFWLSVLFACVSFPVFSVFYRFVSGVVALFSLPFAVRMLEAHTQEQ